MAWSSMPPFTEDVFDRYPEDKKLSKLGHVPRSSPGVDTRTKASWSTDHRPPAIVTSLGVEVFGRRPGARQTPSARFERLTAVARPVRRSGPGRGATDRAVLESAYRTNGAAMISAFDVTIDAVDFSFDLHPVARRADSMMACAAAQTTVQALPGRSCGRSRTGCRGWSAVIFFRAKRWHDVRRL